MGLDLGTTSGLDLDFGTAAQDRQDLRESAEAAIQAALKLGRSSVSFNTAASLRGRDTEIGNLCHELRQKYPALTEIVPSRVDTGATIYLNKKPGRVKKLLFSLVTAEM
ncbi:MAG: hypothetical protein EPN97_08205 [Alphaproteobacteria bacterium]|nr:MAG: hypothetical protein EPN97_08205 [Alphaproteobacteria bacterium]